MRPVFIMCSGSATRMAGALSHPKQFIRVNGETLIERTLRLLKELGVEDYPFVVIPSGEKRFDFEETITISVPELPDQKLLMNISRAVDSVRIEEPVTVLLGDVCWSKKALESVLNLGSFLNAAIVVGRLCPSTVSGKPWDERFAIIADATYFRSHYDTRCLKDLPPHTLRLPIPPDDFTEDIDFAHELLTVLPNLERMVREEK